MGLVKRIFGEGAQANGFDGQHIDLTDWSGGGAEGGAEHMVRVAELSRYEDLRAYTSHVYEGDVVVLDIGPIEDNDLILKRVTNDLKETAQDVGGDVAGIGKTLLMLTPGGMKVARKKMRGGEA